MRIFLQHPTGWLLPGIVLGIVSRSAQATCADELSIEASAVDGQALRKQLTRSNELDRAPLDNCRSSRIRLRPLKNGWRLDFSQGPVQVTRDVQTIPTAAMWIENWLLPAEGSGRAADVAPPESNNSSGTTLTATLGTGLEAGPTLMVAPEGSTWLGPELGAHVGLSHAFWLGPRVAITWPVSNEPADTSHVYRFGTSVGYNLYNTRRLLVSPYATLGVVTMLWHDKDYGSTAAGPMLGAGLEVVLALSRSLHLVMRTEIDAALWDDTQFEDNSNNHSNHDSNNDGRATVSQEPELDPTAMGVFGIDLRIVFGGGA